MAVGVENGRLIVEPQQRPRYTLEELLAASDYSSPPPEERRVGRRSGHGSRALEKRGDIYTVSLDPTVGHEQRGHRPVLIVSPTAFNQATKLPVVLPIRRLAENSPAAWVLLSLSPAFARGIVRCDQPRVLDIEEARQPAKKSNRPATELLDEVLAKTITLFSVNPKSGIRHDKKMDRDAQCPERMIASSWRNCDIFIATR